MHPGDLVAQRFRVGELIGAGGMGTVHRATDETTGDDVAIKSLRGEVADALLRFEREGAALERLDHPSVVRYVARGRTPHGPYLVMEWLRGEDLAKRLRRVGLTIAEALTIGKLTAQALAAAHRAGVIHRDVKPSNLFLVDGEVDRLKVVDFGLARLAGHEDAASVAGMLVGTPGYMAPEQARAQQGLDGAVDVFALGCVLYRCLSGRGAFTGPDALATLAKVLFDEPAPLSALREDVPRELASLVHEMLRKAARERPTSADLVSRLEAVTPVEHAARDAPVAPPSIPALTEREQRVVSVVLAASGSAADAEQTLHRAPDVELARRAAALREIGARLGARVEVLASGVIATLFGHGSATDQAARAARLSLELARALPGLPIAVATGRAEVGRRVFGEVVDRAWEMLVGAPASVRVDDVTAGLLGADFELVGEPGSVVLLRERPLKRSVRTLLGKPTPCVGRDRELAVLDALYTECASEPIARAVVVRAPAGVGKSRLRHEWLASLSRRSDAPRVLLSRAEPVASSAPHFLTSQWLREAAGISASTGDARARAAVSAYVRDLVGPSDAPRVADFLSEMLGLPSPAEPSLEVRAARLDAVLMSDQLRRACLDWLGAEVARGPLVLVLEDLHWADAPSVKLAEAALRRLDSAPLLVAAFARPEVSAVHPNLWEGRVAENITLGELTPKAAARLVRATLGEQTADDVVAEITTRAAGNAFFLEEMIRAHAEGRAGEAPPTVRAVVARRLEGLPSDARRVLRAASVFGQTFWAGGVLALLGGESNPVTRVGDWVNELVGEELVSERPTSRFEGHKELVFRHAIVRDAAYDMLTDEDRRLGHRLAGEWLERSSERDAVVLAQHFDRGGDHAKAAHLYVRAAAEALEASDLDAAADLGERASACGASGELLGEARRLQAEAARWRGNMADAETYGTDATSLLRKTSVPWYAAMGELATVAGNQGHGKTLDAVRAALLESDAGHPAYRAIALARASVQFFVMGDRDAGDALIARAEKLDVGDHSLARPRVLQARAYRALSRGDYAENYAFVTTMCALYDSVGDRRNGCVQTSNLAFAAIFYGAHEEAEAAVREVAAAARALGLGRMIAFADQKLGQLRFEQGRLAEAIEIQERAIEQFHAFGDARLASSSRLSVVWARQALGDVVGAFAQARVAVAEAAILPPPLAVARATLADLELAHGSKSMALELSTLASDMVDALGGVEHAATLVRAVHADALHAAGREEEARAVLARELARIGEQAQNAPKPEWREWIWSRVTHHRRIRDRALAWGVPLPTSP